MQLVSIIMPCHNGEIYLSEAVESVINQTYKDWELLIINDNSSDKSFSIINSLCAKDNRIKLLNNQVSSGFPSTPRNIGIENAKGRYIAFLDCDDKWLPEKLEKQIELLNDKDCAIAFSYYKKMDEKSVIREPIIKSPSSVKYKQYLNGNCIGNLTAMYDTKKTGKIYQKEIHHEDYLMWLEILKLGYIAKNTNTVEAIYRESKKSTSGNKFAVFSWTWNIYRNELMLNIFAALYHFCIYAIKGFLKFIK